MWRSLVPYSLLLCQSYADNFAVHQDTDLRGSTISQPEPSSSFQQLDVMYPFLIPLPDDFGSAKKQWPNCAWQVATEPGASSFGLLDLNAYYHTLAIWDFGDDDVYRITGKFPAMRYFSFQTYEFTNGKPVASIIDEQIIPKTGKNPYADCQAHGDERGVFEVYLTATGAVGYANELRAKRESQWGNTVVVIYRLYDRDMSTYQAPCVNMSRRQQFWGFAEPATVEYLEPNMALPHHTQLRRQIPPQRKSWEEFPPCSDFGAALFQALFSDLYPVFKRFPTTPASCPMATLSDELFPSMILFGAGAEHGYAARITSYVNHDARYLYWCTQESKVGPGLVIRIQGKLPHVPTGLYTSPRIAERQSYDARFISISTIDMLYPSPTYQEYSDHDIEHFYAKIPDWLCPIGQQYVWSRKSAHFLPDLCPTHRDRSYSIIVAINSSIPAACHLYDSNAQLFLAWNDTYRWGLEATRMPSLIYRELLPRVKETGQRSSSLAEVKQVCEAAGGCADGNVIREVMGDTYPQIDVWDCNVETGMMKVLA